MPDKKVFLDTNIIIYAYDTTAGEKHESAHRILVDLWNSGLGVLSTQVLQEFFVAATRKIPRPMYVKTTREIVQDFLKWNVVINDGQSILDSIDIQMRYKYSFWDSMIIDAAVKGGAEILLSEDLTGGQRVKGVKISNPFI